MDIAATLGALGFDVVHAFAADQVAHEPGLDVLRDPSRPRALLVGNTRALWPVFATARARDPDIANALDPIELYSERSIVPIASALGGRVYFSHRLYDARYLPFQRLAVAAGLAALSPSQLLIHPTYGPWFALRAVIVGAGEATPAPRATLPCACDGDTGCVAAFERASAEPANWRAWVTVRDACPVGRAYRYSEQQIAYHYTKDAQFLP